MSTTQRESRGTAFNNIVTVLTTPITWSMIAEKLGVSTKSQLSSSNGRGILSISGEVKRGIEAKYRIDEVDFDITPNTCVIGDLCFGVSAKVKITISQGKKPFAVSIVMLSDRFKH